MSQSKRILKLFVFLALILSFAFSSLSCLIYESNVLYSDTKITNGVVTGYGGDTHVKIQPRKNDVLVTKIDVKNGFSGPYGGSFSYPAQTLTIPSTIKEITQRSLTYLTHLEAFYVDSNNPYFQSIDGVLYNKPATVLLWYPAEKKGESFTIPDGIRVIADSAFSHNTYLKEIIIPDTVTEIGSYAFSDLDSLKEITIPDSVTKIKENAFSNCILLENISIGSKVNSIGDNAFYHCKSLESVTLPDSLQTIGVDLFKQCTSLKEVTLPKGITSIRIGMFSGCTALTSFVVPDTVRHIEDSAFSGTGLKEITLPEGLSTISSSFQYCTSLTSITIPASLRQMGSAFRNCTNLENVTFLGGGTNFSTNCFVDCKKLAEIYVQSASDWASMSFSHAEANPFLYGAKLYIDGEFVTDFEFPSGTKTINSFLFADYSYLESVTIPEGVEKIEIGAFMRCDKISEITLPSTVNYIESSVFSSCTSLKTLYLPSLDWWLSLKQDHTDLFENAETVYVDGKITTTIVIPEGTKRIESFTFHQCDFLTDVYIPVSVRRLNSHSFSYCGELNIHYSASTKEFEYLTSNSPYWCEWNDKYTVYCSNGVIEP